MAVAPPPRHLDTFDPARRGLPDLPGNRAGLAPATIRAYRSDLADFAATKGVEGDWSSGPEAAVRYLAAWARRGRRDDPGLAPTSLRRRAAAIKGFYRFAFGEGFIAIDVAAHLDLPRMPRLLPRRSPRPRRSGS